MAEPRLTFTRLAGRPEAAEVLVVGPSLGTSVAALWEAAARRLADRFEVIGWDLPGHGRSEPAAAPFTVADLAGAVRRVAEEAIGGADRTASYAGVSLGGAVALQLAVDPGVFRQVTCLAGAAAIGEPGMWRERAALVRRAGTPVMVASSAQRWFAPGFLERHPASGNRLLLTLSDADKESYALACEALAGFQLLSRLGETKVPLLVAAGAHDVVVPPDVARRTADAAPGASFEIVDGCGHLPPAEAPDLVATMLRAYVKEPAHG